MYYPLKWTIGSNLVLTECFPTFRLGMLERQPGPRRIPFKFKDESEQKAGGAAKQLKGIL